MSIGGSCDFPHMRRLRYSHLYKCNKRRLRSKSRQLALLYTSTWVFSGVFVCDKHQKSRVLCWLINIDDTLDGNQRRLIFSKLSHRILMSSDCTCCLINCEFSQMKMQCSKLSGTCIRSRDIFAFRYNFAVAHRCTFLILNVLLKS